MANTKSLKGPKKKIYPDVDAAVIHFVEEACAKGTPINMAGYMSNDNINCQIIQNNKFLKLGEVGASDSYTTKNCHVGIKYPSVKRFQLIFKRIC
jgi:hypothetical protein